MAKSMSGMILLELVNPGQRALIDVSGIDKFSASASNYKSMGSAVVELVHMIGSDEVSFSPSKTISGSSQSISPANVDGIGMVAFVVITKDKTVNDVIITYYGEETQ